MYRFNTENIKPLSKFYFKPKFSKKRLEFDPSLPITIDLINDVKECLSSCFHNMVFSKLPYYTDGKFSGNISNPRKSPPDSRNSALSEGKGNCLSYSYYLKDCLEKMGYRPYIISSKPPSQYSMPGYTRCSHVAVVLPYSTGFILMDPALYVQIPVVLEYGKQRSVSMVSPYKENIQTWTFDLVNNQENLHYDNKVVIPSQTPIVKCTSYINHDPTQKIDEFEYHIREIINPDLSITVHTNYCDERIFVASSDKEGNPIAYTCLDLDDMVMRGYNRDYHFNNLDLSSGNIDANKLYSWEGFSQKQCDDLQYHPDNIIGDFSEILKKLGVDVVLQRK